MRQDLQRAHAAYQDGKLDEAETICISLLERDPKLAKAHQLRCLIAKKGDRLPDAEAHIKAALDITPEDPECLNTYGNILRLYGRLPEAITAYQASLKAAPNYLQAVQSLGEIYLLDKNPMQAASVFETALKHHEGHPGLMRGLLFSLKDSQQVGAALALLDKIPVSPDLALTAGQLFAAHGRPAQAQAAFSQALAHPATSVMGFRNLIQILWMREGYDAARGAIDQMIKASPDAGFVYVQGADLLKEMGKPEDGLALLTQAEARFGRQADISAAKADIFIDQGEAESAFEEASWAQSQRQNDISLLGHFCRSALMVGKFQEAHDAAKAAHAFLPNNQFWIAILATAQRGLGGGHETLYNYDRLVKAYDLEAPPEYENLDDFLNQLKTALSERHDNNQHPIGQSLRNGKQTSADLRFADSRVIQDFFQALTRPLNDYIAHIGDSGEHPLTRRTTGKYRLTGAWSVQLTSAGFHVNHVHPEGWISSSFYVEVPSGIESDPDKKGWIKFGEPPFAVPGQSYEHIIAPKAGRLVLFPSYMWHGTVPIGEDASRMTLPFDAVPA